MHKHFAIAISEVSIKSRVDKFWVNAYEPGVPAEIGELAHVSVGDYIHHCCTKFADTPALSNFGNQITYTEFDRYGLAFAGYLQQTLSLAKGERLAVMLPNILQYPVVVLGALRAGLVVVNFNPYYSARELREQLIDCGATAIVIFAGCAYKLEEAIGGTAIQHIIVTNIGDLFPWPKSALMNFAAKTLKRSIPRWSIPNTIAFKSTLNHELELNFVSISHNDLAFLQYTGGTTGAAKGAMLSHGNLLANIEQTHLWLKKTLREGRERVIVALPLYHIFALTLNFMSLLQFGGIHCLVTDPRDTRALIGELKKTQFTVLVGVNTLFAKLLGHEDFRTLEFNDIRLIVGGGAAMQSTVAKNWRKVTGAPICQAYGLTEASPGVSCNPLHLCEYDGTVGVPVPSTLVQICNEKGSGAEKGEPGELLVKGPQVMQGYWGKESETANVITKDGWLRTGDIATMNAEGFIRIVDRQKDLIIVSGFKVYPNEIEEILIAHPCISDAGVVGEPHTVSGEIVKAFVVRNDPELTLEAVEAYCSANMTAYKTPDVIIFIDEIPKSKIGKVLRRKLRDI